MASKNLKPESSLIRTLSIATVVLVTLLAIGSFSVSFNALRALALTNGFDHNSFILPLILDGGIIVFSLCALRFELSGVDSRYPMTLVVITTVASIFFNVLHGEPSLIARSLSAMPPLLLFLSFELLMRQVRLEAGMTGKASKTHNSTSTASSKLAKALPADRVGERRKRVANLHEKALKPQQIAQNLGVSIQTVYRDLAASKDKEVAQ